MKKRGELQERAARTKSEVDMTKYRKLRNQIVNDVKRDKLRWSEDKLSHIKNDSAQLWKM